MENVKKELVNLTLNLDKVTGTLSVIADGAAFETDDCHLQDAVNMVADFIRANITKRLDAIIDRLPDDADDKEEDEE